MQRCYDMKIRHNLILALLVAAGSLLSAQRVLAQSPQFEPAPAPRNAPLNMFNPAVLNNLAVAKARRGEYSEALALLERAARLTPKYKEVQQNRERLVEWIELAGEAPRQEGAKPASAAVRSDGTLGAPPALWVMPNNP